MSGELLLSFEILSLVNKQRNICTSSSRLNYVEWLKKKFKMQLMCLCQKLILVSDQSVVCTVFTSLLKYWLGSIGILTMCYWLLSTKYVNRWSFAVTGMNLVSFSYIWIIERKCVFLWRIRSTGEIFWICLWFEILLISPTIFQLRDA